MTSRAPQFDRVAYEGQPLIVRLRDAAKACRTSSKPLRALAELLDESATELRLHEFEDAEGRAEPPRCQGRAGGCATSCPIV